MADGNITGIGFGIIAKLTGNGFGIKKSTGIGFRIVEGGFIPGLVDSYSSSTCINAQGSVSAPL